MKRLKFRNNDQMPAFGLGTWKSEPGEVYTAVRTAIKSGYRHIDCAPAYNNEAEVGKAFADAFAEGDVTREEFWVTSKLWNNSHRHEQVVPALKQTLSDLQLDYLDLWIIHWPVVIKDDVQFPSSGEELVSLSETPIAETWQGMIDCQKAGLTRHIGVSNFSAKKLEALLDSEIPPEMNQVELHPLLQQNALKVFCEKNNIHLTGYSPLGSPDRHPSLKAEDEPDLLGDPIIRAIAERHAVNPGQVLMAWALNRGTAVIPKSVNPDRIKSNIYADKLQLTPQDMNEIASMDRHYRYVKGQFWALEGSDYTVEKLWDE